MLARWISICFAGLELRLTTLAIMANIAIMKVRRAARKIQTRAAPARGAGQASYTATQAKNEFGHLLDQAIHGTTVVITRHDSPRAVLISMDQFEALQQAPQTKLNALSGQFDALLERMQTPAARRGMAAAFNASPKQLGKAAVKAARKRG